MVVDVRVGIVAYEVADELARCLRALPAALGDLSAEVVVVDNGSRDDSAAVAAADRQVHLVRNRRNVGYARAMNQALAGTHAPALIALNPDTVPSPGSLAALVGSLDAHPRAGLMAPPLTAPDGRVQHSAHPFPRLGPVALASLLPWQVLPRSLRQRLRLPGAPRPAAPGPVDWVVGAVHCIRRAALTTAPPYRERWFMYVEDVDLCWRLRRAGWGVRLVDTPPIVHLGGASAGRVFGDGTRARWLRESYDWYALGHGRIRTRLYAVLQLAGDLRRAAGAVARTRSRRGLPPGLRRALAVHARTVVCGPAGPSPPVGRPAEPR